MTPFLRIAILTGTVALALPASGEEQAVAPKGVVELFTSQGCSSCPKADAAFRRLATRKDVVALSYHVDYWNYLGWADTLSSPENTQRQYDYAAALGRRNVYTPQAVINGRTHLNGGDLAGIEGNLTSMAEKAAGLSLPVTLTLEDDCIDIAIGGSSGIAKADVLAAYFTRSRDITIEKGENAGKTITYSNIVTDLQTISMWQGKPLSLELPLAMLEKKGHDSVAILVQAKNADGTPGPILGAALLPPISR